MKVHKKRNDELDNVTFDMPVMDHQCRIVGISKESPEKGSARRKILRMCKTRENAKVQ